MLAPCAVDNLLFVGGNVGRLNAEPLAYTGKVGGEVMLEQAYEMARRCALNHLAAIKAALGDLDRVERVVKVTGYVNAAPGFNEMPKVINGESDLLVELLGEQGRHARAARGWPRSAVTPRSRSRSSCGSATRAAWCSLLASLRLLED